GPTPDVRGDRGGHARAEPVGPGCDSPPAIDGGDAEGQGAPVPAEHRGALAAGAGTRGLVQRERATVRWPEPAAGGADLLRPHQESGYSNAEGAGPYGQDGQRAAGEARAGAAPSDLELDPGTATRGGSPRGGIRWPGGWP